MEKEDSAEWEKRMVKSFDRRPCGVMRTAIVCEHARRHSSFLAGHATSKSSHIQYRQFIN